MPDSFAEFASQLKQTALATGLSLTEFWDCDFTDLKDAVEAHRDRRREQALTIYRQAELTAAFVGCLLGGKAPSLYEAFPELFKEEAESEAIERAKAQMIAYAEYWNNNRRQNN